MTVVRHPHHCRLMLAMLSVGSVVLSVSARYAHAGTDDAEALIRVRQHATDSLQHLRNGDLALALESFGEATDTLPRLSSQEDAGLASAAAGLNRQLARLESDQRYDLLYAWTMPTESRKVVRVATSPVPLNAPPKDFARRLGERPRNQSFTVAEINGVRGLFSTAWLLVQTAKDTGRLRGLIVELTEMSRQGIPGADHVLTLARIINADSPDGPLSRDLKQILAKLSREQPPNLPTSGIVPRHLLSNLVLAAACLDREWLRPIGKSAIRTLLDHSAGGTSLVIRPLLQRASLVAVASRSADAGISLFRRAAT